MRPLRATCLAASTLFLVTSVAAPSLAEETVAPGLADDAIVDDASSELAELLASLDESQSHAFRGSYIAVDENRTDVAALPACDDDGDYVVVLSRGMLELLEYVAYADASDRLRGTHLVEAYGALLARDQRQGARPLPPPAAESSNSGSTSTAPLDAAVHTRVQDALAWLIADELAHAALGSVVCPHPTITREHGDSTWTAEERATALAMAPSRMANIAAADAWATSQLDHRGRSRSAVVTWLRVLAPLEAAALSDASTHAPSTYLALHPGTRARIEALCHPESVAPAAATSSSETSRAHAGMR